MPTGLVKIIILPLSLCLISMTTIAMKNLDPFQTLPMDLIIKIIDTGELEIKEIVHLSEVNHGWEKIFDSDNENLWQLIYQRRISHTEKLDNKISYKNNIKTIHNMTFLYIISACVEHTLNFFNFTKKNCILDSEIFNTYKSFKQKTKKALNLNPKVLGTCYSLYDYKEKILNCKFKFLNLIKEKDVLLVLPAGNDKYELSNMVLGSNIHELYPNILWTAFCNKDGTLNYMSNYGDLINMVVKHPHGTGPAAKMLADFAAHLRRQRPDLTAEQICQILIDSSDISDETKLRIPNGGILNMNKAIIALKQLDDKATK